MNFEFATAARILFGNSVSEGLGEQAAALGRHAFVLTGSHPARWNSLLGRLENHHVARTLFQVGGEPSTAMAAQAAALAVQSGCDLVIGIGGGSVLDTGKVVAAILTNGGEPADYLEGIGAGKTLTRVAAPYIAVPTTAGTGTEVTRNAVLESTADRVKVSMRSLYMLPRLAMVDPELTYSMPPAVTAATGLDALAQLLEAFLSRNANPLTDGVCREGLLRAARSLAAAVEDGGNAAAREDMCLASLCGGLALANSRLGAVHGLAGPFGGMVAAPHGAVCGRLLPFVMAANAAALGARRRDPQALARFDEAARLMTGSNRAMAEDGIDWLHALARRCAIPPLGAYGFRWADAEALIARSMRASSMRGNPVELTAAELKAILKEAM
jgi:alcohol dehydrogenase class IV